MSKIGSFNGEDVSEVHISGDGVEATVMTFGAALRELKVDAPGGRRHVILGFPNFDDHVANKSWHYGAVPGRFANRINHGKFSLDGKDYNITLNEGGKQVCHGGPNGFGMKNWKIEDAKKDTVTLVLESKDGEEGFPGNMEARVTYTAVRDALKIEWTATSDAPTVVNLTTHAFFNLNGNDQTTIDHKLEFEADHYTPINNELIPTGEIKAVEGGPFDFRKSRTIRHEEGGKQFAYDHNIVLRDHTGKLRRGAELISSAGDLKMEVWTDQPGIQLFDSAPMDVAQPGHSGVKLGPRMGLCLEPQNFPDAINHSNFPDCVLRPGEKYSHHSELRFSQV